MHNENKIPSSYSTLNNDVIPDDKFLNEIDKYHPKLSQEIVKSKNNGFPSKIEIIGLMLKFTSCIFNLVLYPK